MKKILIGAIIVVFVLAISVIPSFALVDWSAYNVSNLALLPYSFGGPNTSIARNGLTISVLDDGKVHIVGTAVASTALTLFNQYLVGGQTYNWNYIVTPSYDGAFPAGSFYVDVGEIVNGAWNGVPMNSSFTAVDGARYNFYFEVNAGFTVDLTFYVTLHRGYISYSYQPYIPFYIDSAITAQYDHGIFGFATITATLSLSNGSNTTVSVTPNFTAGGVYFKDFALSQNFDDVDSVYFNFVFPDNLVVDYLAHPFYISGDSDVSYATLITPENRSYSLNADGTSNQLRKFAISGSSISYPVIMKSFVLQVGRPEDLVSSFTLYSNIGEYNSGYSAGFNEGVRLNNEDVYLQGKESGYKSGFIEGKAEGLALSESGDWRSLIGAVVEAPVNTFQSLFDFEILGVNLKAVFGSVLALCVLLIVIKKVVL